MIKLYQRGNCCEVRVPSVHLILRKIKNWKSICLIFDFKFLFARKKENWNHFSISEVENYKIGALEFWFSFSWKQQNWRLFWFFLFQLRLACPTKSKLQELTKQFMCNKSARNSTNTDKVRNDKSLFNFTNNGTTPSGRLLKPQTRWRWPQVSFGSVFFELYGLKRKFHANGGVIVTYKSLSMTETFSKEWAWFLDRWVCFSLNVWAHVRCKTAPVTCTRKCSSKFWVCRWNPAGAPNEYVV